MKLRHVLVLVALGTSACASDDSSSRPDWSSDGGAMTSPDGGVGPRDAGGGGDASFAGDAGAPSEGGLPMPSKDAGQIEPPPPPPCVVIRPMNVPDLKGLLPAGDKAFLRVRAELRDGPSAATKWQWRVAFAGVGLETSDPETDDPAIIYIQLKNKGTYTISLTVSDSCSVTTKFMTEWQENTSRRFAVRLVPPPNSGLPTQTLDQTIFAGKALQRDLQLEPGVPTSIVVKQAQSNPPNLLLRAFVQVMGFADTRRTEGTAFTVDGFRATLAKGDYNVLIVPEDLNFAPLLVRSVSAGSLVRYEPEITPGVRVAGTVTLAGAPLVGAGLILRQEPAFLGVSSPRYEQLRQQTEPSTFAVTDVNGRFTLRARPGTPSLRLDPPKLEGKRLPVLALDARSARVYIAAEASTAQVPLSFDYAVAQSATLHVLVKRPGSIEAAGLALVRLQAMDVPAAAMVKVGTSIEHPVGGMIDVLETADGAGQVQISNLPRALYQATFSPDPKSAWAAAYKTVVPIDLRGGDRQLTVSLANAVQVSGKVEAKGRDAAGLLVVALDENDDAEAAKASAQVRSDGTFSLSLSPNTSYRLRVDSPYGEVVRRTVFGSIRTSEQNQTLPTLTVPSGLRFSGRVLGVGPPLPGTIVQAFCTIGANSPEQAAMGVESPHCIDLDRQDPRKAVPISEAVAGPNGDFTLVLPDPGSN